MTPERAFEIAVRDLPELEGVQDHPLMLELVARQRQTESEMRCRHARDIVRLGAALQRALREQGEAT